SANRELNSRARQPVIDMTLDDSPWTAQQRITEVGRLPRSACRARGRAGAAALTARHGHDGLVPEIRAAALAQLPEDIGLDGELVVWERDRLAFERLQQRLARRGAAAAQAAREWPAHFAFSVGSSVSNREVSGFADSGHPYRALPRLTGEIGGDPSAGPSSVFDHGGERAPWPEKVRLSRSGDPMSRPVTTDQASATAPKPRRCYSSRN
ncbi:hypothetical protein ACFWWR_47435, partial [Streptomyces sp. NPDC058678]